MPGGPSRAKAIQDPRQERVLAARDHNAARPSKAWPGDKGFGGIHADLNGAYNIGRKACPSFVHMPHLSLAIRIRVHVHSPQAIGWRPASVARGMRRRPGRGSKDPAPAISNILWASDI